MADNLDQRIARLPDAPPLLNVGGVVDVVGRQVQWEASGGELLAKGPANMVLDAMSIPGKMNVAGTSVKRSRMRLTLLPFTPLPARRFCSSSTRGIRTRGPTNGTSISVR
ncbi:hypothetical protein [Orlajensenia leifsoniae]|uniref:Uncharacterized protein n=1 Tax=Orlajensenia leifsoniae TaxID=2561933 RepID=A0A4Y9R5Q5_9MICO|nr:hypothetical protein [Leifsonia flava]TFV99909.1 hypothetical protein E4M00_01520 [Leifsonia flava]